VESTYVLPGVPAEMRAMFERVADEFEGERQHVETVFAAEPESELVERFEQVQAEFDVTVGSYPGDGVRIRVSATDQDAVESAATWLRERVDGGEE
jgi:molybdopterin-biosynthesis enzyme MoeA-like protein